MSLVTSSVAIYAKRCFSFLIRMLVSGLSHRDSHIAGQISFWRS